MAKIVIINIVMKWYDYLNSFLTKTLRNNKHHVIENYY